MRLLPPLVLGALLCACQAGLHSSSRAAQTYRLRMTSAPLTAAGERLGTLEVMRPLSGPALGSERILIAQSDHRLSYYAESEWAAQLPLLVEDLAVARLRASGDWTAVTDAQSGFASEYFLQLTILSFEAQYTQASSPTVQVALHGAIGRRADRLLLDNFTAQATAVASANRLSEVVSAFEVAANAALDEVAQRSSAAIKNAKGPSPP